MIRFTKNQLAFLFTIFICILNSSCQNSYQKTENQKANFTLEIQNSLNFNLENHKTAYTRGVQVYPNHNPQYLLFFHSHRKYTSIYDLKSQDLLHEIHYDFKGPNAVPKSINYAHMHNFDSIFLFDPLPQQIYLVDSAGNNIDKYDISLGDMHFIFADGGHPAYFNEGTLYFPTSPSPMENATSSDYGMIEFDIDRKAFGTQYNLSEKYDEGFWDKHSYRQAIPIFNEVNKNIIMSFPNDEYIYVIDAQGNKTQHFAGSSEMNTLKPLANEVYNDDERTFRLQAKQGFYSGFKYDRWRKVYYRFVYNPTDKFADRSTLGKNASIIILNKDFEIVGESPINAKKYSFGITFINKEGLHLFNNNQYEKEDDSEFSFDLFKLKNATP
ncbi:DUF4221 family protein [Marivirga harenae]|uniref:DUF4221 family protein n=1 Tax=Marivirga harenae TaxID=2010992 RepID=UPI0026E0D1ED|nr:DUF4221 family protein [Marivirga harenae]WKV13760.1 DUF4221 family protein [Marivirga harenae]